MLPLASVTGDETSALTVLMCDDKVTRAAMLSLSAAATVMMSTGAAIADVLPMNSGM
jgi:hypothetical protein